MKLVSVPATVRVGDQVQEKKGQRRLQIFCPDPLFSIFSKASQLLFYHFIRLQGLYGGVLGGTSKGVWEKTTRLQTADGMHYVIIRATATTPATKAGDTRTTKPLTN